MKQREKLIELIIESVNGCARHWAELIADHLLANGVVVLPCRCGECAYCEDGSVPWCNYLQIGVSKDAYCAGGKRKGGGE